MTHGIFLSSRNIRRALPRLCGRIGGFNKLSFNDGMVERNKCEDNMLVSVSGQKSRVRFDHEPSMRKQIIIRKGKSIVEQESRSVLANKRPRKKSMLLTENSNEG
jgi:hypothetical protein